MDSLYTGVSGMLAHQKAVSVIGNNVANLNTVGYKSGRVSFQDTLVQTMSTGTQAGLNPMQFGTGVAVGSIEAMMTPGSLRQTSRALDMAVVGSGFFVVGPEGNRQYTRAGIFQLDNNNRLVLASNAMRAVGWSANIFTGAMDTSQTPSDDLRIPMGSFYAVPTGNAKLGGNLDASVAVATTATAIFDAYDSIGTTHQVTFTFTKTAGGAWDWAATSPDAAASVGSGTLTFDAHGRLTASTGSISMTLTTPNGATNPVDFDVDFSALSQLDGASSVQITSQDGLPMGTLDSFTIDEQGQIMGAFSNGATRLLGQLALAHFSNPAGLLRNGSSVWLQAPNSGEPVVQPASSGGSSIRSGYLEQSNVDLTAEFAELIVAQRGFQANSRSITTSDDMMQEILQIKR